MYLDARELQDYISCRGRTLFSEAENALYFNWSCSGIMIRFAGSYLDAELEAFEEPYPGETGNLPVLSVCGGQGTARTRVKLRSGLHTYRLFQSDTAGEHWISITKLSELSKGRNCLRGVRVDGRILPSAAPGAKYRLELIGDSITCGFGVDMRPDAPVFTTESEDGTASFGAAAADSLGAEYNSLCISGVSLCKPLDKGFRMFIPQLPDYSPPVRAMEDYYIYTDRLQQEAEGRTEFTRWDFSRFRPHFLVVNLGTNDACRIAVSDDPRGEETHFILRYMDFLSLLRRCNGGDAHIVCSLGPMNYYLFDSIRAAVAQYRSDTGDGRISTLKFSMVNDRCEPMGGLGHPSRAIQKRMGAELAAHINAIINGEIAHA